MTYIGRNSWNQHPNYVNKIKILLRNHRDGFWGNLSSIPFLDVWLVIFVIRCKQGCEDVSGVISVSLQSSLCVNRNILVVFTSFCTTANKRTKVSLNWCFGTLPNFPTEWLCIQLQWLKSMGSISAGFLKRQVHFPRCAQAVCVQVFTLSYWLFWQKVHEFRWVKKSQD